MATDFDKRSKRSFIVGDLQYTVLISRKNDQPIRYLVQLFKDTGDPTQPENVGTATYELLPTYALDSAGRDPWSYHLTEFLVRVIEKGKTLPDVLPSGWPNSQVS